MTAWVEVTTYAGMVPGASHYRAQVFYCKGGDLSKRVRVPVEYVMTRQQATRHNKDLRSRGEALGIFRWRAGQSCSLFFSRDEAVAAGVDVARQHGATLVLVGSHCVVDPQPVAYCDDQEVWKRLSELNAEAESIGHWQSESRMKEISSEWDRVMAQFVAATALRQ